MRHHNLWKKTAPVAALALASILALGAPFAAFADEDDDDTPLTLIDGYIDDDEPEEDDGEEDVEEEDLDLDWEEDEGFEGDDEQSSPEDLELQDYFDANAASDLIELYGSLLYKQTMWNADGSETAATGFIYENKDIICCRYIDKFEEIITKDDYVGYDNELEVPVRYVFDSDDTRAEMVLNYEELVYLWGNEHVVGKQEKDGKVIFTTEMDDSELIGLILADFDGDILEGDKLTRDTTFDADTKIMEHSLVKIVSEDGSTHDIFECSLEVEPKDGYEENKELLEKLNAEDKHKLTLTLDPGTENEKVITAEVGKGCAFYPVLYDGYSFFTDPECTQEADEKYIYNTEDDINLYTSFTEIYDEDMEVDGDAEDGEYEITVDGDEEIDLSELLDEADDADDEEIVG